VSRNCASTSMHTAVPPHFLAAHSPQKFYVIPMETSVSGSWAALAEAAIVFITAQDSLPTFESQFPVCAHGALIFSHHLHGNSAALQQDSHRVQLLYQRQPCSRSKRHTFLLEIFTSGEYGNLHKRILKEKAV